MKPLKGVRRILRSSDLFLRAGLKVAMSLSDETIQGLRFRVEGFRV